MLLSFANNTKDDDGNDKSCQVTRTLVDAMPDSTKTYLALCDGDGSWNGVDYSDKGWFVVDKPVKDENGRPMENSVTHIRFISSSILPPITSEEESNNESLEGRKVSIVLARPKTGRWHQVRQHLFSIGHGIIGDSTHGRSRTNRIWKKHRKLMKERTCLHLCRIQLSPTDVSPTIDVSCPLSGDLLNMLQEMPELLDEARPILAEEGINIME